MNSYKLALEAQAKTRQGVDGTASGGPKPFRNRTSARMFAAAQSDRFGKEWGTEPLAADDVIERNQRVLVARSREQAANNDYGKSFLRMARQNIVGPKGITLRAESTDDRGKLDTLANEAIEWAWFNWGHRNSCDVTGKRSWREIQKSCVNSAVKDGEFMLRMIYGPDSGEWGFAIQVLDPQRCPILLKEDRLPSGGFIRQGIEFNRYGRPLAYYFSTIDETEANYRYAGQSYIRVPADEIVHGFLEDMVGQKRGLPWMATALFRMRQLAAMEEASIINARTSANKRGFITWESGKGPEFDADADDLEVMSEPGEWQVLPDGAQVEETSPQYPSGEFSQFMKQCLRGMSAGFGVLYNNLASDLEGVNFSSIRQGTLDEREYWKDLQEWLIESLHQPVFEKWLPRALLGQKILVRGRPLKPERLSRYSVVSWQGRRWEWIDPRADVDAAVEAKNNMLKSPGAIIREQGQDPLEVWKQSARDIRTMIDQLVAEGVTPATAEELVLLSMGRQPPKPATGQQNAQA